jgi:ribose-phosphate pyrophosphokinase
MQMAGANRIITLRLHNPSSYNAHPYTIPIVNVMNRKLLVQHILSKDFDLSKFMIVSPDLGAAAECRKIAEELGIPGNIIIINKYRNPKDSNNSEVMDIIGDPRGFNCIMPDDMADTCGTALKSFIALKEKGALDIYFSAVHPILSGNALENLAKADFKGIWFCNTCNLEEKVDKIKNLDIIPVTKLMAKVIDNLHNGESITDLSKNGVD